MNNEYEWIDRISEEEVGKIIDRLKRRVIIPMKLDREDLSNIMDVMTSELKLYSNTNLYPLLTRYDRMNPEDRFVLLGDILEFLLVKNTEMETNRYWTGYVDELILQLEGFDEETRDKKIDNLIK